jgi:4-hydroxyphenylpyruvate dioxygenase
MLHSIATVSLSGGLRDKLEAAAAAGFGGVEIFENDLLSFDGDATAVRHCAEDLGLQIVAFQPFRDFEGMPEPQRTRVFERAERKFDLMEQLGTDLLLVCSNVSPVSLGGIDRAAADLRELGERAGRRDLKVGFEALAWGRHINDYRDAWEAVRRADHPAIGTILDSFHILSRQLDLNAIESIPADRIFMVQLADAPLLEMGVLPWSRHFRCFPGQGRLPLLEFMRALEVVGYDGIWSLEVFNDQFRAAPTKQTAADGRRSLLRLTEQVSVAAGEAAMPRPVPPPANYQGLEFLEFAVDEETATQLEALFRQLGFRRGGQHRSKAVSLWCQGDINLVVNRDQDSFAQRYNLVHGPSVCAMGLRVDDARQALERSKAYLCRPFMQMTGPGELQIPAIRGLENSLVYLVDRYGSRGSIWEVDFELDTSSGDAEDAGLSRVDHLGQVMPYGQLSSWQLFYCSVFGFEASEQFDIADPSGLIQSQVVETTDRSIRIALNASQSDSTSAMRFVSRYYGGGTQQLAFATDDIVATLCKLEANGLELLPIPQNYYDDLEARFGLEPEMLETLRRHNILYDQSGHGEFFHAYTRTFADRFFFEIVQRRNYDEFGLVNAPIRLAAQARLI